MPIVGPVRAKEQIRGSPRGDNALYVAYLNTGRMQTLTYDNLNRIGSAQSQATSGTDCWGQGFGYDRYGNLLNVNTTQCSAPTLSVTVNGNNQITNTGFTYDAAGNLTNDGANAYNWDAENRLKSAAGVNYTYDGDNWRVQKSNGELDWYSPACGHDPLFETDLSGNVTVEYVFLGSTRIARRDASGSIYFYFGDHIRSDRVMTNASGVTQQESDYHPFGTERVITNNVSNDHKFTGKKRDAESGLDYSFRRMYHAQLGRWTAADPMRGKLEEPQSHNRYGYVINNPVNLVDPKGLFWVPICFSFHIPCPFPPNKERCVYYDQLVQHGDKCDKAYGGIAGDICRNKTGTTCFDNCARGCLIDRDHECRSFYRNCALRSDCRVGLHVACFGQCLPAFFEGHTFVFCAALWLPDQQPPAFLGDFGGGDFGFLGLRSTTTIGSQPPLKPRSSPPRVKPGIVRE